MSKALRLSEKWFRRGLWLVAVVFAGFLIGLGGTIVGDLPEVETPLQVDDFLDRAEAEKRRREAKGEADATLMKYEAEAAGVQKVMEAKAEGYRARIVGQADGDAQRFRSVLVEYQKAPQVTRDRMYTDSMAQVYSNVTKVMVDTKAGSNLLYLPLDKIMQMTAQGGAAAAPASSAPTSSAPSPVAPTTSTTNNARSRERESR